ncbi:uncharacterized protein LY89DRAFT_689123 [Mollisia scopiformis]|uniref:Glycosyltransferase family 69 protein n=1 Tax=Mollisia scopiformis TaxID=149040 RepID=A0A194WUD7_MOLSC|nr:uncharacterized protein LY89DRAFT_689123 [Mollisia scopiformis]KUJ11227.1 hypothetical protein LY89DRAFT_689123 [Mollisia scopiformis]
MALISRSFRRRYIRPRAILLTLTLLFLFDAYLITSFRPPPTRSTTLPSHLKDKKIFIASIHRNSEYMLRLYWNSALLRLCEHLGPKNVYVSILESGSLEDTKGALRDLMGKLNEMGVQNRIELGMDVKEQVAMLKEVPEDPDARQGWIFTGRGQRGWEVRRIAYLAELRNRAMEPLEMMEKEMKFDTILWINDVVFTSEDVTTLLATRDGDYAAACALDFSGNAEMYYDTFALRDSSGLKSATGTWPYFSSHRSLRALQSLVPIPVQSCWNGLIALDATPFYTSPIASSAASPPKSALKFRALPDSLAKSHLEASECCLIHADNPLRDTKGVFLNPNVRVSYNASTYSKVNWGVEVRADMMDIVNGVKGGDGRLWPGSAEMVRGLWRNRAVRWMGWVKVWSEKRVVERRVRKWISQGKKATVMEKRSDVGIECMVNEMQVLYESGWQHV